MSIFTLVILLILLPMVSAIVVAFINNSFVRGIVLFNFAILGAAVMAFILVSYNSSGIFIDNLNLIQFNNEISFSLQIEPFTLLFASLISLLWPITVVYTVNYMKATGVQENKEQKSFYFFLSFSIAVTLGIAFSGNLITTFLFYEALTLLTYPLVIFNKTKKAESAGRTYLGILLGASMTLFLPAIILVWIYAGSVTYSENGLFFSSSSKVTSLIFIMFLFGVSKAALMPFHGWLPKAMVAPSPVSALLHAVAVVKSGVFVLIKIIIYIFGVDYLSNSIKDTVGFNAFLIIPAVTILLSSLINLFQDNFKRLLAYSTVGQLSYILLCILLFNKIGIIAAAIYFVAHALAKIVLFFQAGYFIAFSEEDDIKALSGIGAPTKLPVGVTVGALSMFSILNLPFTLGFIAKFYLLKTIITSEEYWVLAVITISYVFTIIYFSRTLYYFYFATPISDKALSTKTIVQNPITYMALVMIFVLMINILLFFTYDNIVNLIQPVTMDIK